MPSHVVQNGAIPANVVRQQVDRILQSGEFSGSEVLRHLLAFLTTHSIEKPGEVIKEYDLAVGALGKPEGFDPRMDSAVRVHTTRLRAKLAEYYMSDGLGDEILIEVPKGSYQIAWHQRSVESIPQVRPELAPVPQTAAAGFSRKWFAIGVLAAVAVIGAAAGIAMLVRAPRIPPAVELFWRPFLQSPQPPVVVFSNHRFVGTSATGLRIFREGVDSPADRNDTYSGTGTVMAVAQLSEVFALAGRQPRLKRAELLTWDEAQDANLVFVGAPDANSRLRELAPLQHFRFKSGYEEPRFGLGGIVNVHPLPGEEPIYFGSGRPYSYDYAVVALLPNLHPGRKVVIIAGTNTYGCQGAMDFITRADLLPELYARLGVSKGGKIPDFEALLRVGISGGVPIRPHLVAIRTHLSAAASR